jgi:hypothetical protein
LIIHNSYVSLSGLSPNILTKWRSKPKSVLGGIFIPLNSIFNLAPIYPKADSDGQKIFIFIFKCIKGIISFQHCICYHINFKIFTFSSPISMIYGIVWEESKT